MDKKLTIIMVGRNHLEQTQRAVKSLNEFTDKSKFKLIFMDSGSTDETNSWLSDYCRKEGIELRYQGSSENVGWIFLINMAYRIVDTEFSLTCHNDVVFSKGWFENMMRRFEDPEVAAVGPMITYAMGAQALNLANYTINCEVKYLLGLFFMCRDSVIEEIKYDDGTYLSEAYGMGDKEELELCYRIRQRGYKLAIARDVIIEHEGEKSFVDLLGSIEEFHKYQDEKRKILDKRLGKEVTDDLYRIEIKNPIKLMVGILTRTEYVHYRNMISFLKIWGSTNVWKTFYHIARGHPANSRNQIVREFLKTDCTHLLFIDDDMFFEHDAIMRLLNHDVDIASGIAYQRGEPHAPCIFLFNSETKSFYPYDIKHSGLVEVDAIGGFFFLIKRKVLEGMKSPWFVYGDTSLGFNDNPDPNDRGIGEDVYFSAKAKLSGFKIFADTDLIIGHLGKEEEIDDKFYESYKASGKMENALKKAREFKLV